MKLAIDELNTRWKSTNTSVLPRKLPIDSLKVLPNLYQPRRWADERGVSDERHVKGLAKLIAQGKDLDPIVVLPLIDGNIVIDGHHRLEAYKAQKEPFVPVRYFPGNPEEALLEAGRENSKDRLGVNPKEKSERAWTLAISGCGFSKRQIADSAQVSERTVGNMREVIAWYKENQREPRESWGWAKWEFQNKQFRDQREDFDREAILDERANLVAQALRKRLKTIRTDEDAVVFARAILGYCPSQYQWTVLRELANQSELWEGLLETIGETVEQERNSDF